jgi:hypothetical protein
VLALLRAVGPLDSNYNPGSIFDPDEHDFNPAAFGPGQPIYPASDQFKQRSNVSVTGQQR